MDIECRWMHAALNAEQRNEIVTDFQEDHHPLRVIVGTRPILGQGITLCKAIRGIIMEPGKSHAIEENIRKRWHRIGSVSDRCWSYRLYNPESKIEEVFIANQRGQKEFHDSIARFLAMPDPNVPNNDLDTAAFVEAEEEGNELADQEDSIEMDM